MADEVQIDGIGSELLYETGGQTQVDGIGAEILYSLLADEVAAIHSLGVEILYSIIPDAVGLRKFPAHPLQIKAGMNNRRYPKMP